MASSSSLVLMFMALLMLFFCIDNVQVSSDADIIENSHTLQVVKGPNRRLLSLIIDCEGLCLKRCELHSRPNVCTRACGTCCVRCKCVPPGTHGNRQFCGKCYTDMTTHRNKTKCP